VYVFYSLLKAPLRPAGVMGLLDPAGAHSEREG